VCVQYPKREPMVRFCVINKEGKFYIILWHYNNKVIYHYWLSNFIRKATFCIPWQLSIIRTSIVWGGLQFYVFRAIFFEKYLRCKYEDTAFPALYPQMGMLSHTLSESYKPSLLSLSLARIFFISVSKLLTSLLLGTRIP